MFKTFVSLLLNFLAYGLFAQYASDSDKGYPLIKIVHEIERSSKKKVFYDKNLFLNDYVSEEVDLTNTETALIQLFSPLGYTPVEIKDAFIIVKKKEHTLSENVTRTQLVKLRGTIKSSSDQEPIIGATIQLGEYGAVSDTYGNYSLTLPGGAYDAEIDYLGWETHRQQIELAQDVTIDFELFEKTTELNEIVISARNEDANVSSIKMSSVGVKLNTIRELPTLLGEVDVFRIIQQVPGVSTVGEGTSGVNVRGSEVQENLMLLDNIPLFNGSHIFGFFSTVNGDMLDGFELVKAGLDPSYGGRTSALLDMRMKTGDFNHWHSKVKLSNILTSAVADGPIVKDKVSITVGGRINYSDYLLQAAGDPEISRSSARFYDLGTRTMAKVGKRSSLSISQYLSGDQFKFAADTTYSYSNQLLGFNWDYRVNRSLTFITSGYSSSYNNNIEGNTLLQSYDYKSSITATGGKIQMSYKPTSSLEANVGLEYTQYRINPDEISPNSDRDAIEPINVIDDRSRESSAFGSVFYKVNNALTLRGGLRYTQYQKIGEGREYVFETNEARSRESIIDTLRFEGGKVIQKYKSLEPRVSFVYRLSKSASVKGSYQKTAQFIHQLSNSVAPSPFAVWRVSNTNIRPRRTGQVAFGYFQNLRNNIFEASVEGYFKTSENNLDFKNLADLINNEIIEADLIPVEGRAYGIELFLRKNKGLLKGWVSYTYSRSEFRTSGSFTDEIINENDYYLSHFDRPHIINSSISLDLSRRWTFGFNFNYSSGRPVSYPTARYTLNDVQLIRFSERNSFRINDYHRLDFSVTLKGNLKREQLLKSSWTFSVYNVYARNNPFSIFFGRRQPLDAPFTPYQLSIIAIPVPSITWNLHIN